MWEPGRVRGGVAGLPCERGGSGVHGEPGLVGVVFSYFKGQPTEYVMKFSGGRARAQGRGLSFYYLVRTTSIVVVPTQVRDAGFVFNELTNSFQTVTVQGSLTYRVTNPAQASSLIDFSNRPPAAHLPLDGSREPARADRERGPGRGSRGGAAGARFEETLRDAQALAGGVLERVRTSEILTGMGIEVLTLSILSASPTKEVARALEAEYRESLLGKADEATFARRSAAVEAERKIKERELQTDTALAEQRSRLIRARGREPRPGGRDEGRGPPAGVGGDGGRGPGPDHRDGPPGDGEAVEQDRLDQLHARGARRASRIQGINGRHRPARARDAGHALAGGGGALRHARPGAVRDGALPPGLVLAAAVLRRPVPRRPRNHPPSGTRRREGPRGGSGVPTQLRLRAGRIWSRRSAPTGSS